jgi:S1-C subfamily serine protease
VEEVSADSPAAKAGFKKGDRIVEVVGKAVTNYEGFLELMRGRKAGEPVEMAILRDGKRSTIKVTPE